MLKITGVMLLALGLVAGLVLVASPFGMLPFARSSFSAWVLFPTSSPPAPCCWNWRHPAGAWLAPAILLRGAPRARQRLRARPHACVARHPAASSRNAIPLVRPDASRRGRNRVCAGAGRCSLRIEHTAPPRECIRAPLSSSGCWLLYPIRRAASSAKCSVPPSACSRPTAVPRERPHDDLLPARRGAGESLARRSLRRGLASLRRRPPRVARRSARCRPRRADDSGRAGDACAADQTVAARWWQAARPLGD